MLFDLRGRGRRRTVKVIYVSLALLFGVGFVGFGVGVGGGGGGLLDAFTNNNGTNGASFDAEIKKDRKLVAAQPSNPAPLAKLIQDLLRQAGTGDNYNSTEGTFTAKASGLLHEAQKDWQRYLALNPSKPSSDLASEMLQVFSGPGGLNEPAAAVSAMQIVIAGRPPSEALYADLAQLSYKAGNTRQGDLASTKAVALAPKAQRILVKTQLEQLKKNPTGGEESSSTAETGTSPGGEISNGGASGASGASGAAAAKALSKGGTVTIGGKTYKIKPGGKGITTVPKTTSTAPAKGH